jgi:membrane protease YdiL (CAAX protease family)
LLGAALAPALYQLGHWAHEWSGWSVLSDSDFSRYFNRSILFAAVALLAPILWWTGLRRFSQLGLQRNPYRWRDLLAGVALAAGAISLLGSFLLCGSNYQLKEHLPLTVLPRLLLTALVVAIIEESLFRGAIFGLLRQSLPAGLALVITSSLFAIVHLVKPPDNRIDTVTWHSGFDLLLFFRSSDPLLIGGAGLTLFVLGLLLGYAVIKTSSLWLSIGLHAGLVFAKMSFNKLTKRSGDLSPWFGSDLTVGFGAILILVFLWFVIWLIFHSSKTAVSDVEHVA